MSDTILNVIDKRGNRLYLDSNLSQEEMIELMLAVEKDSSKTYGYKPSASKLLLKNFDILNEYKDSYEFLTKESIGALSSLIDEKKIDIIIDFLYADYVKSGGQDAIIYWIGFNLDVNGDSCSPRMYFYDKDPANNCSVSKNEFFKLNVEDSFVDKSFDKEIQSLREGL